MHFQLHDSDILAKASFPFTRSTFRAKLYLKRIKQKVPYLHFKHEMSFLLRNLRNAIRDHHLACLCLINPRETFTAGTCQGHPSFSSRGLLPVKHSPKSPSSPWRWDTVTEWVLSFELLNSRSIFTEDLTSFLILGSLVLFSDLAHSLLPVNGGRRVLMP